MLLHCAKNAISKFIKKMDAHILIIEESSVLDSNGVNFIQINKTKQLNSKELTWQKVKK